MLMHSFICFSLEDDWIIAYEVWFWWIYLEAETYPRSIWKMSMLFRVFCRAIFVFPHVTRTHRLLQWMSEIPNKTTKKTNKNRRWLRNYMVQYWFISKININREKEEKNTENETNNNNNIIAIITHLTLLFSVVQEKNASNYAICSKIHSFTMNNYGVSHWYFLCSFWWLSVAVLVCITTRNKWQWDRDNRIEWQLMYTIGDSVVKSDWIEQRENKNSNKNNKK